MQCLSLQSAGVAAADKTAGFIMPYKPPHPCNYPGCPALTTDRFCPTHRRKDRRERSRKRKTAAQRGYGYRWQKARRAFLDEHPYCECVECRKLTIPKLAEVVDHIIPHKGDPGLFWDPSNWRAMAKRCHDRKTATEDGGFGQ